MAIGFIKTTTDDDNIIYVSSKKNIMFYFYLAKNFFDRHDTIILKACGAPISTAVIVAEMLIDGKFVRNVDFATSTIEQNWGGRKVTQLDATIQKRAGNWVDVQDDVLPKDVQHNVFISATKPPQFWMELISKFLQENGACTVMGCGNCISLLVSIYERYSVDKKLHRGVLRTVTKVQGSSGRSWKKTQMSFHIKKL